jgi:hypothetical protein
LVIRIGNWELVARGCSFFWSIIALFAIPIIHDLQPSTVDKLSISFEEFEKKTKIFFLVAKILFNIV